MMRLVVLCLAVWLLAPGCGLIDEKPAAVDESESIMWDGRARTYRLHVPATYDPATPAPLVLAFHGSDDRAANFQAGTGFDAEADARGFITVYPESVGGNWAEGCGCNEPDRLGIDDVGLALALADTLAERFAIDPARVFALGFSQGGLFVQRLACEQPGRFAAIATVAATLSKPLSEQCTPEAATSMLIMHGTEDPVFPWEGTNEGALSVLGAEDAIAFWREKNACPGIVNTEVELIRPGYALRQRRYRQCAEGTEVHLYAVEGGGHTWPRDEIKAAVLVADFFGASSR